MRNLKVAAFAATTLLACGTANATPIAAGGSVAASYLTPGTETVLATNDNVAFTSQAPAGVASTFSGTYSASVFRDSNNTLCGVAGQCLTFSIQFNNSSSSTDGIETATTGPFSNLFAYNVGYNNSNGGKAPIVINDSSTGTMQFDFRNVGGTGNVVMPGQSSAYLLIQSSATNYVPGSISFQDNQTATVAGFIPALAVVTTPVPEVATWAMMIAGFGMAGYAMRRRRQASVRFV